MTSVKSGVYWKPYPERKPTKVGYYIIKEQSNFFATEAVQCFFWNGSEQFPWDTVKWFCEITRGRLILPSQNSRTWTEDEMNDRIEAEILNFNT